ncbi:MAG: glycosyltransferase [Bacteroidia bacterium]|nr:glycosyltransferase [Bacteroidia bacterium]
MTPDDEAVSVESEALLDTADPFSYISTARAIRKWDPDILIMRYWMSYFGPSLGFVARHMKKKCKVISILDNVVPHEQRFFDKPFTRYFLSGSDGFITMCSEVENDLLSFGVKKPHIVKNHPLYSHFGEKLERGDAENLLGLQKDKKNILFFGLIRQYKGLDILLKAFKDLDESYQLIIAGEPYGSFEPYQKLIDESGAEDRIKLFPQYIKDSEVKNYFSAADVTVLPYRSATQSGISSVSYHFEVPMIVTAVGGLKETIGDRGTGIVAEAVTPESIKAEIERYFSDNALKESCIEHIKEEKQRLSWSGFAKTLLDFSANL